MDDTGRSSTKAKAARTGFPLVVVFDMLAHFNICIGGVRGLRALQALRAFRASWFRRGGPSVI